MIKRIKLKAPGAYAWKVTEDGPLPDIFNDDVAEKRMADVPLQGQAQRRKYAALQTVMGPIYVRPGDYLVKTDAGHLFGAQAEDLYKMWEDESVH